MSIRTSTRASVRGAGTASILILAGVGLAACSSGDGNSSPPVASRTATPSPSATRASAPPPAPVRSACYQISYDQALAPTSDQQAVGCDARHSTQTFLVGRLQAAVAGHLVAVDSDIAQREVADTCPRRLATYLGGTPDQLRLSLLRSVWFTPTVAESDAGASWFRCDVVAAYGNQQLADLTGDLQGSLSKASTRAAYAMCATDRPGAADFQRVLCRDPHTWRAISTVDLSGLADAKGHFPGQSAVKQGDEKDGTHVCADAARGIAANALDYQWGYEWPTRDQWRTGQDYGRCWAPDSGTSEDPSNSSG